MYHECISPKNVAAFFIYLFSQDSNTQLCYFYCHYCAKTIQSATSLVLTSPATRATMDMGWRLCYPLLCLPTHNTSIHCWTILSINYYWSHFSLTGCRCEWKSQCVPKETFSFSIAITAVFATTCVPRLLSSTDVLSLKAAEVLIMAHD